MFLERSRIICRKQRFSKRFPLFIARFISLFIYRDKR